MKFQYGVLYCCVHYFFFLRINDFLCGGVRVIFNTRNFVKVQAAMVQVFCISVLMCCVWGDFKWLSVFEAWWKFQFLQ